MDHRRKDGVQMKIYGNCTVNFLERLNMWKDPALKTPQKFAGNPIDIVKFEDRILAGYVEQSKDQITISREGMEYMRDILKKTAEENGQSESGGGSSMSLEDRMGWTHIMLHLDSNQLATRNGKEYDDMESLYEEYLGKQSGQDVKAHGESLWQAYADMRDRLEQEYADGTREVWTQDYNMGDDFIGAEFEIGGETVRYRKLTLEEEMAKLDDALERLTEDVAKKLAKEQAAKDSELVDKETGMTFSELMKETKDKLGELKDIIALFRKIDAEEKQRKEEEEKAKEVNIGQRLQQEASAHLQQTAQRGQQQRHYGEYVKMSGILSNVRTLAAMINVRG